MLHPDGNQLTEVPKEIGNLVNLAYVVLEDNQLTEVPKEIDKLVYLII
jgi:Leucine-rich repeat (LRR) protein